MTMKIYEIIPGKLLQSARTHIEPNAVKMLQARDVTGVVNLWHTPDIRVRDSVNWYHQQSLPDGLLREEAIQIYWRLANRVAGEICNGGCVLTHCYGGRNRSGLLSALTLIRLEGITGAEALRRVQAVRISALKNEHFAKYLRELTDEHRFDTSDVGSR